MSCNNRNFNINSGNRSSNTSPANVNINLISLCVGAFVFLAILKVVGAISTSWAIVLIPLWVALGLFILSLILALILCLAAATVANNFYK